MPLLNSELEFLYGLMREGIKLDLGIMRSFSSMLENPQDSFRSIHIAGTNGKGSTAAFIYNIMRQSYGSGLYTSPHLVRFNERIIFGMEQIDDSYITSFVADYKPLILDLAKQNRNPTFFETTTMLAFKYFADRKADYASVEVGLGGRLDSTNIIMPEVSVIGQIGYEHADKLGCSLTSIATEKGGIIKPGIPVVLSDDKPEVVRTIRSISSVREAPLTLTGSESTVKDVHMGEDGTSFSLSTPMDTYHIQTKLLGDFQVRNISTAVLAIEKSKADRVGRKEIEEGVRQTRWPGRLEIIREDPRVILDSAHNPAAAASLVRTFSKIFSSKPLLVIGMLSDKDAYSYLSVMKTLSDSVIFTSPKEESRAMDPHKMDRLYGDMFASHMVIADPLEAYEYARSKSGLVLVTGSMYLVGFIKGYEEGELMPFSLN